MIIAQVLLKSFIRMPCTNSTTIFTIFSSLKTFRLAQDDEIFVKIILCYYGAHLTYIDENINLLTKLITVGCIFKEYVLYSYLFAIVAMHDSACAVCEV